jgi:hypothetical protein
MRTFARAILAALIVTLVLASGAGADTIYSYTGDTFRSVAGVYTTADRITGSFTVADGFVAGFSAAGAVFTGFGRLQAANGDYSAPMFMDGVISYSFTDGHQTLTKDNSTAALRLGVPVEVLTPGSCTPCLYKNQVGAPWPDGFQPRLWDIEITTPTGSITSYLIGDRYDLGSLDAANSGVNGRSIGPPDGSRVGTWTVSVPEPSTLVLLAAGLSVVGGRLWKRRHTMTP